MDTARAEKRMELCVTAVEVCCVTLMRVLIGVLAQGGGAEGGA